MNATSPSSQPAGRGQESDCRAAAERHYPGKGRARFRVWPPRVSIWLLCCATLLCLGFVFSFSGSSATKPLQPDPVGVFRGKIRLDAFSPADSQGMSLKRLLTAAAQLEKIPPPEGAWRARIRLQSIESFAALGADSASLPAGAGPGGVSPDSGRMAWRATVKPAEALLNGGRISLYGEPLGPDGAPLRWGGMPAESWLAQGTGPGSEFLGMCEVRHEMWTDGVLKFAGNTDTDLLAGKGLSAARYREHVERYAGKYKLATSLVFAIMHTESNFNPFAVSRNNALGLMQVVAATAGGEVYAFLTGKQGTPSMETLFDPEHNIHYGAAYLHLLTRRYFGDVIDKASREMCVIAAYNGGPGAVLRVFDPDMDMAIIKINTLTPEELYAALTEKMPSAESRRYVSTVISRMRNYN